MLPHDGLARQRTDIGEKAEVFVNRRDGALVTVRPIRDYPDLAYTGFMLESSRITLPILTALPHTQAIYLFGSAASGALRPDSDVDIAVLLPAALARRVGNLSGSELRLALESGLSRDVDLINLRQAPTVFQNQIIVDGRRIHCADEGAADEFEMHVLSLYQKLQAERAGILADGLSSGRFLGP